MDRKAQIKQWLKQILDINLPGVTYHAFIFGSQANKEILSRADIDIGIIANTAISSKQIAGINDAIEQLPMLFKIDVVDFKDIDPKFRTVALSNTELL